MDITALLMWALLIIGLMMLAVAVVLIIVLKQRGSKQGHQNAFNEPNAYNYTPQQTSTVQTAQTAAPVHGTQQTSTVQTAQPAAPVHGTQQTPTVQAPSQAMPTHCSRCGSPQPAGTKFCGVCGNEIG